MYAKGVIVLGTTKKRRPLWGTRKRRSRGIGSRSIVGRSAAAWPARDHKHLSTPLGYSRL